MEREKELQKLVNVLRRTARSAQQAAFTGGDAAAAAHGVSQYNRVLVRMKELEERIGALFEPLPAESSFTVLAMACRELAAYFEDEVRVGSGWGGVYGAAFDAESFKDFWSKSADEVQDLGEFIRESVDAWARKHHGCGPEGGGEERSE